MSGKIGEGHAEAMLRQGIRELRGSMYTGSNVAQQPEYGLYGTLTPGEIQDSRRESPDSTPALEEEKADSPLQQSMKLAKSRSPDPSVPEIGLEK